MRQTIGGAITGAAAAYLLFAAYAFSQSTNIIAPNQNYTITSFPLYGAVVTPSDTVKLTRSGMVRADAAGTVKAVCDGNLISATITLELQAGEFVPCVVSYVFDTDTDAITLHVFY